MKFILPLIVLFNFSYSDSMFSLLNQNALYFSYSNWFDTVNISNQGSQNSNKTTSLGELSLGYVYNGIYDFSIQYIHNKSLYDNFHYLNNNKFYSFNFKYNLNDFDKLPFNMQLGGRYTASSQNSYESNSFVFNLYKEYSSGNYPVIPFLQFDKFNFVSQDEYSSEDTMISFGLSIKLVVDNQDNDVFKDIIYLKPVLRTYDLSSYFFDITIGLYHPIS